MRLSLSSFAFSKVTAETAIGKTSELGFNAIELSANRPHLFPRDYPSGKERNNMIKLVKEGGLTVAALTSSNGSPHWHLTHPNHRIREDTISYIHTCIDLACDLDCRIIEVTSGRPVIEGVTEKDALAWIVEALGACSDYAKSRGKIIGFEPESNNFIYNTSLAERVIRAVNSSALGYLLDTGHINLTEEDISDTIKKIGKRLVHVHAHDNDSIRDLHLLPGKGKIDFASILTSLHALEYNGFISIEIMQSENEAQIIQAREYLQSLIQSSQA